MRGQIEEGEALEITARRWRSPQVNTRKDVSLLEAPWIAQTKATSSNGRRSISRSSEISQNTNSSEEEYTIFLLEVMFPSNPIPLSLSSLHKLRTPDLSFNLLFGPIQPLLGKGSNLSNVILSHNHLSSSFPPFLSLNLVRLDLSNKSSPAESTFLQIFSNTFSSPGIAWLDPSFPSSIDSTASITLTWAWVLRLHALLLITRGEENRRTTCWCSSVLLAFAFCRSSSLAISPSCNCQSLSSLKISNCNVLDLDPFFAATLALEEFSCKSINGTGEKKKLSTSTLLPPPLSPLLLTLQLASPLVLLATLAMLLGLLSALQATLLSALLPTLLADH